MKNYILKIITILFTISILSFLSCSKKYIVKNTIENNYYNNINFTEKDAIYKHLQINRIYEKTINATYKHLMASYSLNHYGVYTAELIKPKMIIIHSTASHTLKPTIDTFMPDVLVGRNDAKKGGSVNLGSHFVVDRDGSIYSIIPLNIMARHTIGFNYTAIGIENVGYPNDLTYQQLMANVRLIKYLEKMFASIEYVIGHHEFNKKYLEHYYLAKQVDNSYRLLNKIDPGESFMYNLRKELKNNSL